MLSLDITLLYPGAKRRVLACLPKIDVLLTECERAFVHFAITDIDRILSLTVLKVDARLVDCSQVRVPGSVGNWPSGLTT